MGGYASTGNPGVDKNFDIVDRRFEQIKKELEQMRETQASSIQAHLERARQLQLLEQRVVYLEAYPVPQYRQNWVKSSQRSSATAAPASFSQEKS
ncbi:MAG: hypothetical protein IPO08_23910 [Xanthomonadales bacterium]|nr:hypothetical protein [Xanthomonadales bacterium]